jgi:hypothetical protein
MDSDRSLPQALALAVVLGLILAILYLLFLGSFWASWIAGAFFCLCAMVFARLFGDAHLIKTICATVAGALSGLVWWAVADTQVSWWVAPSFGAALTLFEIGTLEWREWRFERVAVPYDAQTKGSRNGAV